MDFVDREAELEAKLNSFAAVILAFLKVRQTDADSVERKNSKVRLVKLMAERGLNVDDRRMMFSALDWLMQLKPWHQQEFYQEMKTFEEENYLDLLSPTVQMMVEEQTADARAEGLAKGLAKGRAETRAMSEAAIEVALRLKFGPEAAEALMPEFRALNMARLPKVLRALEKATSREKFRRTWSPKA